MVRYRAGGLPAVCRRNVSCVSCTCRTPETHEADASSAATVHWMPHVADRSRRVRSVVEWASYWPGVVHPKNGRGSEEKPSSPDMIVSLKRLHLPTSVSNKPCRSVWKKPKYDDFEVGHWTRTTTWHLTPKLTSLGNCENACFDATCNRDVSTYKLAFDGIKLVHAPGCQRRHCGVH